MEKDVHNRPEMLKKRNELLSLVSWFLSFPEKASQNNPDREVPKRLWAFLIDKWYIKDIHIWEWSWGFKYNSKDREIFINENKMPNKLYDYYVFRLGKNSGNWDVLFPAYENEIDQYRFLHEVSHAYQSFLTNGTGKIGLTAVRLQIYSTLVLIWENIKCRKIENLWGYQHGEIKAIITIMTSRLNLSWELMKM